MNWNTLQTYGLSSEKSFEMLCNQLFENWCKDEYKSSLVSFSVVNGAGGDGGVESYAVLNDDTVVGVQAKWFRNSIDANSISQIRGSVETAKKIRPKITRYIVCVPRDLSSDTGRGKNTESKRWDDFIDEMKLSFPDLSIELWNDTRITTEMQKPLSAGIQRYWFSNSEIEWDKITDSFDRAKRSWLSAKYVPDLNSTGKIKQDLNQFVGSYKNREALLSKFRNVVCLCLEYERASSALLSACNGKSSQLITIISDATEKIHAVFEESEKISSWLLNESSPQPIYDRRTFYISYESIIKEIEDCKLSFAYHFHIYDVIKVLNKLNDIEIHNFLYDIDECLNKQSILFLGNPGTGKTHGVAAFANELLAEHFHIPIVIQARSVPDSEGWREIVLKVLGLASVWNEDELWQALISAANRSRFQDDYLNKSIFIYPKVLIIVDGIDESPSHQKWIDRIKESEYVSEKYSQIRFCFTSRPAVFSHEIDFAHVKRLNTSGDVPAHKLFDAYIQAYDVKVQNCQWLKFALNTPLALKLFCELHRGRTITVSQLSEVSMNQLWRSKIERIQNEYNDKEGVSSHNQNIFNSIIAVAKAFDENQKVYWEDLISAIRDQLHITDDAAQKILSHLESYGIVGSYSEKGTGIEPDRFVYYPGIQGYLDYASAMKILNVFTHPSKINFEKYSNISENTLYSLFIISIQQFKYLLTSNKTIESVENSYKIGEFQFYALQHTDLETASQFKERTLKIMREDAESLTTIVNRLVLPLSRSNGHPLGTSLLDEFLNEFVVSAQRDIVWSLPPFLRNSEGKRWKKTNNIAIIDEENEEYDLTLDDVYNGLPIVYAWMLSNVSNPVRKQCRDKLMVWARKAPDQFSMLFLHFADVNDPQIKSDLFSVLMCLVYDGADVKLIKEIADWILNNTLSPSNIEQNRDASIRYYAIAIIQKAVMLGLYAETDIKDSLPPYDFSNMDLDLNRAALSGTRMSGYSAISYDLARYVLVDHFDSCFNTWQQRQLEKHVKKYSQNNPNYSGISNEQFIISAAYAFILRMGWNEEEFYNFEKDASGHFVGGVDSSINVSYHSASHGAQSPVMTVCEKYVWAARNYISGYLCDRLSFGDAQIRVTDYSLLDDFLIPAQEIRQIDPDNIPKNRPWHVPEPLAVTVEKELSSKESVYEFIKNAPDIDWNKWICFDKDDRLYSVPHSKLLALNMYACFYDAYGVETCLFVNSILLPRKQLSSFVSELRKKEIFERVCNPTDWNGGIDASCYITPKEVCWFPWKMHYDSFKADEFPDFNIYSAVDQCCYNFPEYSDVYYSMPSAHLRSILGIVDTDGYLYFDKDKNVVAEYSIAGEKWRTTQEYVLVGADTLLQKLYDEGLCLVWIMQEYRRETGNAKERFGDFFVERRQYSFGYYDNGDYITEKVITDFSSKL